MSYPVTKYGSTNYSGLLNFLVNNMTILVNAIFAA